MCGINGIYAKNWGKEKITNSLITMNQLILHRGPDEGDHFTQNNVGLGMRRLSIIDLSNGSQPMLSDDEQVIIVFNGEIYNYQALRNQLIAKGIQFNTQSDTEVILKLYLELGPEAFRQLDGMYAFSIYDKTKNKIFIARDFFGEKPLYYKFTEGQLIWASELKSIVSLLNDKPAISQKGLNLLFRLTYIPAPHTIYDGIFKLKSNHYIDFDLDSEELSLHKIHKNESEQPNFNGNFNEAKKATHDLVTKSILSRTVSDVPIGTFLSGGVDSSIVSAVVAKHSPEKINTFSIGFDKKSFDETDKSNLVAKLINSNHYEFILDSKNLDDNLNEILLNFDEPFADSSALPSNFVALKTSNYVKVALTGDGGDEIFGGYNKYYMGKLNRKYTSIMPEFLHDNLLKFSHLVLRQSNDQRGFRFKLNRLLNSIDYGDSFYYNIISLGFQDAELQKIFTKDYVENPFKEYHVSFNNYKGTLSELRKIDKNLSLEGDMLVKVDRTAMLNSLETRAPFLTKELWDFSFSLPENYLLNNWNKKFILKEAFEDYFPKDFLNKSKQGFGVPVGDWLRGSLKDELYSYIDANFINNQGIFNYKVISNLVENHITGKSDNTFRVWTFYCFQKWYCNIYNKIES